MTLPSEATCLIRLLRLLRDKARISQLELSLRLGVSQRHVSYVELGRANPSRELLRAWLNAVGASPSHANVAMLAAGYSVIADPPTARPSLGPSAAASLDQVLLAHEPFPAFVFTSDRYIVRMNEGARRMWARVMPRYWARAVGQTWPLDMIDALSDPEGLLCDLRDPAHAGAALLALLRSEEWLRPGLAGRIDRLAQSLQERFGVVTAPPAPQPDIPMQRFTFDLDGGPLTLLAVQSVVGLLHDLTLSSPRLELWLPGDARTRAVLEGQGT